MVKRHNWLIWRDMLEIAKKGSLKTRLMYQSNTNSKEMKIHLSNLFRLGLLVQDGCLYYRTEKGRKFVNLINSTNLLLECK